MSKTTDRLNISRTEVDADVQLQIVDMQGRVLINDQLKSGQSNVTITFDDRLAPGQYILQMKSEGVVSERTFVRIE